LVIEVELSPPHVAKRPIYAALAIPEVWCWQDDSLTIFELDANREYRPRDGSLMLPGFPLAEATRVIHDRHSASENTLIRRCRELMRERIDKRG
jgi:hypothetical protein